MIISTRYFKNGVKKAVTMSYDDGPFEDYRLVEIFNKYGLKGSFFLNTNYLDSDESSQPHKVNIKDVAKLYKGHEIAVHTLNHPDLRCVTDNRFREEVLENRRVLENIAGYPVRGMSYPYGTYNDKVVDMLGYLGVEYSRTIQSHKAFYCPDNFLTWHPTCHHNDALECIPAFDSNRWNIDMALFYVWGHSYEFDRNGDKWDIIEEFAKRISGREDTWYATNIEIMDYIMAVRNLKFSCDSTMVYNPSCLDVWIDVDGQPVKIAAGMQTNLK
jgi:peptidoglycan/xylan/chitin deacetylase (PgdA/CDA1 family)